MQHYSILLYRQISSIALPVLTSPPNLCGYIRLGKEFPAIILVSKKHKVMQVFPTECVFKFKFVFHSAPFSLLSCCSTFVMCLFISNMEYIQIYGISCAIIWHGFLLFAQHNFSSFALDMFHLSVSHALSQCFYSQINYVYGKWQYTLQAVCYGGVYQGREVCL